MQGNVIVTGFMCSGKTTVGALAADMLGFDFIDTDSSVESDAGMTVQEVFATRGEPAFRAMEREVIEAVLPVPGRVIALGGGALTVRDNLENVKRHGIVYLLDVSPAEVLARAAGTTGRPLLEGRNARDVEALMKAREPSYLEAADVVMDADRAPEEVARDIVKDYRSRTGEADGVG